MTHHTRSDMDYALQTIVKPTWTDLPQAPLLIQQTFPSQNMLQDEPLMSRGWVFQERLLAPRVLHFVNDQVVWECRRNRLFELKGCEEHTNGRLDSTTNQALANLFEDKLHQESLANRILIYWLKTIQAYSQTTTTFEKDRLFALAGIASVLYHRHWRNAIAKEQFGYYADMWRHRLVYHLAWSRQTWRKPTLPKRFRAPTWSWASVYWAIHFPSEALLNTRALAHIPSNGIHVKTDGSIFGPALIGSSLLMWCNLGRATVEHHRTQMMGNGSSTISVRFLPGPRSNKEPAATQAGSHFGAFTCWDGRLNFNAQLADINKELFCMPITMTKSEPLGDTGEHPRWCQGPSSDLNGRPALHDSQADQFFWSDPRVIDMLRKEDIETAKVLDRYGTLPKPRYSFQTTALLPQRVPGQKGQYRRVGLMVFHDWTQRNISQAKLFVDAFCNSSLNSKVDEVLPMPHDADPNVYVIELI